MKYSLQDFMNISFNGFNFIVPEETIKLISSLSMEVGSPSYIKTPIFQKKNNTNDSINAFTSNSGLKTSVIKKRKGNKNMEVTNEDWEMLRTFQTTKIEKKTGVDGHIDKIRLMLNKLTDKTFLDIREKMITIIDEIIIDGLMIEEDLTKIGTSIFDLASTNKFYSKIYADLYAELLQKYDFLRPVFEINYNSYMELFKKIEYVNPDKDYDRFCDINKLNEKRKAISMFFVNLCANNIISKKSIIEILHGLLKTLFNYINEIDKKNEVDELTENIAILYNKDMTEYVYNSIENKEELYIEGRPISEMIMLFAKSKSKDYKSLSNKAIFKYMDLVDM